MDCGSKLNSQLLRKSFGLIVLIAVGWLSSLHLGYNVLLQQLMTTVSIEDSAVQPGQDFCRLLGNFVCLHRHVFSISETKAYHSHS